MLGAPFIVGLLHVEAERGSHLRRAFGIALFTVAYVLLFAVIVWRTSNALRLSELHRIAVQRDLRKQELRFDDIIRSVMDAVIVMDREHRIVLFNPAAEEMRQPRGTRRRTCAPRGAVDVDSFEINRGVHSA